jgi:hypothetical protein
MSQYPYDPMAAHLPERNGLGVAGFVCSLVGLVTAGILCPIGLLLSLVALGRRPRGFAIAGVILGLVGSCGGLIVAAVIVSLVLAGGAAVALAVLISDPQRLEISTDMVTIAAAVQQYKQQNRVLPASLDDLKLENSVRTDPWGHPYEYHFSDATELGFDLISAGKDGQFGTDDDASLSTLDRLWSDAFSEFKKKQKELASKNPVVITIGSDKPKPAEAPAEPRPIDPPGPTEPAGGGGEN